jgi:hypothetical protein
MRTRSWLALVVGYPFLSGCVQGPALQYTAFSDRGGVPRGDYAGFTKFTLARTLLLVQTDKAGHASALSVPAEAVGEGTDYGVRPLRNPGITSLQLTKIGNTELVRSASLGLPASPGGSGDPGTAVTSASEASASALALALDMQPLLDTPQPGRTSLSGLATSTRRQIAFEVVFEGVPADAIATRQLDLHRAGDLYFYSACRTATVTFLTPPLAHQQFTVTVADPNYVQTVALTEGRRIDSHTTCGVDVTASTGGGDLTQGSSAAHTVALEQQMTRARNLIGIWSTQPAGTVAQALAAVKLKPTARPSRRKGARAPHGVAVHAPDAAPAPEAAANAQPQAPLRNADIRLPFTEKRESYAF